MKTPLHPRPLRSLTAVASLLAALCALPMLLAQSDDFEDGNDTGWSHYQPLKDFGAGGVFGVSGGLYRLSAPASPAPELLGPQRIGSLRPEKTYRRARIQAEITGWRTDINQAFGLIGRADKLGLGTTEGYTYNYNSVSGFHQINLVQGEQATRQVNESPFPLNPAHRYRMVFLMAERILVGQLYSSTNASIPLHSVAGMDENFEQGISGVFAFALTAEHGLDTRFDNYSAEAVGTLRATVLDASPAVGESPAEAIASVSVRLADLETSVVPETVRLEIDGKPAPLELTETPMGYRGEHTPAKPLDPKAAHRARISFDDESGPQSFEWVFGAPAAPAAPVLLSSDTLGGTPASVVDAKHDPGTRTFRVPLSGSARFFRVGDTRARRWNRFVIEGDQLAMTYE